ncbi:MAG: tyrosine-type recombinase/integrase [Halanaerobiales bacterium]
MLPYRYTQKEQKELLKSINVLIDTREQKIDHITNYFKEKNISYNNLVECNSVGNPIDPRNLVRELKKATEETELPEIRFHNLRHTFATLFLEAKGPLKTLQQILGHSSITVTIDTYSDVTEEMLIEAEKKIDAMYKTISSNSN